MANGGGKGTSCSRPQVEHLEERKRREASEKLSANAPDGAFSDDPRADGHDKHGRVTRPNKDSLTPLYWDMGRFPPNE